MASLNEVSGLENPLKASVIIPSYNGGGKIHRLLETLTRQTIQDFEVVVVIDGSTDNTEEVVERYREKFRLLDTITQENGGRAVARNSGANVANADLLIFYDDDMEPYSDSVERHVNFHIQHAGIVCGHPMEMLDANKTDIQNYKAWLANKWTGKYQDGITIMRADDLFFTASNCSIPKEIFLQLNGFNAELTDAEDYELAHRAIERGIQVCYDKDNKAFHTDLITCRGYIRRLREYGKAHKKVAHFNRRTPVGNNGPLSLAKKLVYRSFAFAFWARMIDAGALRFLPKVLRYRLYSVIIHALATEHANVRL